MCARLQEPRTKLHVGAINDRNSIDESISLSYQLGKNTISICSNANDKLKNRIFCKILPFNLIWL